MSVVAAAALVATHSAAMAQAAADAGNGITAALAVKELVSMGYAAKIDQDESSDPRISTTVDGFQWSVYFYDCANGSLEQRVCASFQFYSGYTVRTGFPLETINKWNTEKRYARAYTYVQRDKTTNARVEIDALVAGTSADPAKTFRAYFTKMKNSTDGFRKLIGASH